VDHDQIAIQVRFALQGDLKAFLGGFLEFTLAVLAE
jgi:hypothetical protein